MTNRHSWSGWPGAFCLRCGAEDPTEEAIGLGDLDPGYPEYNDPNGSFCPAKGPEWICSPEKRAEYEARMVCPVDGGDDQPDTRP